MFVSLLTCMGRDDADTVMTGFQWFSSTRPFFLVLFVVSQDRV